MICNVGDALYNGISYLIILLILSIQSSFLTLLVWLFNFVDLISLAAVVVLTRPLSTVPLTCIAVIVALTVPLVAAFCVAFKVTFEDEDKMPDVESLDEVEFAAVVTLTDEGTELSISRVTRTGTDDSFTQKVEKSWTKVVL